MNHSCVNWCCGYRSCWGADLVIVGDGVVVGFVGMVADLSCCFGESRIVGVVADSCIVSAVDWDRIGD